LLWRMRSFARGGQAFSLIQPDFLELLGAETVAPTCLSLRRLLQVKEGPPVRSRFDAADSPLVSPEQQPIPDHHLRLRSLPLFANARLCILPSGQRPARRTPAKRLSISVLCRFAGSTGRATSTGARKGSCLRPGTSDSANDGSAIQIVGNPPLCRN